MLTLWGIAEWFSSRLAKCFLLDLGQKKRGGRSFDTGLKFSSRQNRLGGINAEERAGLGLRRRGQIVEGSCGLRGSDCRYSGVIAHHDRWFRMAQL